MNVKIKKLTIDAVIPSYAKEGDAGMDITTTGITKNTFQHVIYSTGLAIEVPLGYVCLLFPRSSIRNYELTLSNSVGVLDSGYRGEITFTFVKTDGKHSKKYQIGDRIGQMLIIPYPHIELEEVDELSISERGEGGHGSTGN